ncbi:hypothetical protein Q5762_14170 [Streptomyces sp. P9(2023)]|uniref:hypothetical protein n=1 Tax=unclassified Streptomyces TaxID=2593676 RepID=UPI0028F3FC78|nr:hypothetical protein [Streptomyces sp. P9(2023)]MDT9689462.1 hypothetical protein [Streptomyces sp. P9(2023)]WSW76440.1 hypothetical protein OG390_28085 [Streptomyces sp. NBC_00996]
MPRLVAAVYVQDPSTREELILLPGECPDPELAALVTNPDAWDVPPDDCEPEPEPIAVGEPDPTAGKGEQESEQAEAGGGGGAKKSPPRRARSSASS